MKLKELTHCFICSAELEDPRIHSRQSEYEMPLNWDRCCPNSYYHLSYSVAYGLIINQNSVIESLMFEYEDSLIFVKYLLQNISIGKKKYSGDWQARYSKIPWFEPDFSDKELLFKRIKTCLTFQ